MIVINLNEYRLRRQLRSASAASSSSEPCKPDPLDAVVVLMWRKISPSAYLMVDPRNGARAVIRDARSDARRYLWSVLAAGEMQPVSGGRTDDLRQAQSIGEATLCAHTENRVTVPDGLSEMV